MSAHTLHGGCNASNLFSVKRAICAVCLPILIQTDTAHTQFNRLMYLPYYIILLCSFVVTLTHNHIYRYDTIPFHLRVCERLRVYIFISRKRNSKLRFTDITQFYTQHLKIHKIVPVRQMSFLHILCVFLSF